MIVAGRVVMKMLLKGAHPDADAGAEVVHFDGACCSSGGVFDTYAVVQGIDRFMPVDMYVPGCPPRPEQLIQSIIDLQTKIKQTGTTLGTEFAKRTEHMGPLGNTDALADVVTAPGDFMKSRRINLN